ncbi:5-oxoprolinase subunit PxpB [Pontibacter sp. JAM-7]|uniref:5-oxoprolinase subunit PxpB n=1 Tax=Pontibacter sp. JAM-7 TaxID=3366581 RepID=UPI003AF7F6F4
MQYQVDVAGVDSLLLRFDLPAESAAAQVAACAEYLRQCLPHIVDIVPAYSSLLLTYDLLFLDNAAMRQAIARALTTFQPPPGSLTGKAVILPVCYDINGGFSPDLAELSAQLHLPVKRLIELHVAQEYVVQAVGFAPGFAYMGQLSERLSIPRKATPRQQVPAGSVAIAERQTAVYPQSSPGGWWLIGRCPLRLFDPQQVPPGRLQVGDRVRFEAVTEQEFQRLLP